MLPLSFIFPAVWHASRPPAARGAEGLRRSLSWLIAFGLAAASIALCTLGFAETGYARWMAQLGRFAPWGPVAIGVAGALLLFVARSPGAAALLAASGGAAETTWIFWLRGHLCGPEPLVYVGAIAIVFALTATICILRQPLRGRLFRVILSVAFGYLALVAVRNVNLFALVAGVVMAWNLGEWAFELRSLHAESLPARRWMALPGLIAQGGLALVVGMWIGAIASGWFFRWAGEVRRFGLVESPLAYAHEAAKFAGRPGMPDRARADLRQAGVYLFHNGPDRKLFIDGRLEVPSRATFETFVRLGSLLNEGRPGWAEAVGRMGDPLILLDHVEDAGAEATLLAQPGWRCVYYDPAASVFLVNRPDEPGREFPSVDFAGRHFRDSGPGEHRARGATRNRRGCGTDQASGQSWCAGLVSDQDGP